MQSMPRAPWTIWLPLFAARLMKRWRFSRRWVQGPKTWLLRGPLYEFHMGVAHKWREFFLQSHEWENYDELSADPQELCNACRNTLVDMLDVPRERMHCTLKLLAENTDSDDEESALVVTIGRSEPCNRPPEYGWAGAHRVSSNTVFAALCGASDGKRKWPPYSFFGCNDLTRHAEEFVCDRLDWQQYYKSTLALPIRFRNPDDMDKHKVLGFLTFDMPTKKEFTGVPNAFKHKFADYQERLGRSAVLNAAAIMADTLAVLLRPVLVTA